MLHTLAALLFLCGTPLQAGTAETNQIRPYLHWRVGEFAPVWDVLDLRGISLGADFNRRWSVELALDAWQLDLEAFQPRDALGEQQIITLAPLVRFQIPLYKDRVVLYSIAGAGGAWIQFNDRKSGGIGHDIDADGFTFTAMAGAGVDLFLAPNIAFNVEARYAWCDPLGIRIDGQKQDWDASSFLATLGLRIYLDKHPDRLLLNRSDAPGSARLFFGTQGGGSLLADDRWTSGARMEAKPNAVGGLLDVSYAISLGSDFGERLGVELALAYAEYTLLLAGNGAVGEYSMYSAIPMLRWRFPSATGRWVPYLIGGAGVMYGEFNDAKPNGVGLSIRAKGVSPAATVGAGIEYFLARNFSFNVESRWRYAWNQDIAVEGGPSGKGDLSDFQFTFGFRAYLREFGRNR